MDNLTNGCLNDLNYEGKKKVNIIGLIVVFFLFSYLFYLFIYFFFAGVRYGNAIHRERKDFSVFQNKSEIFLRMLLKFNNIWRENGKRSRFLFLFLL